MLNTAVDAGLLARSPCQRIELPKIESEEMRFCTPEEILALAAAMEPRYRTLIVFDAFCGLRLSELAGLQRQHLDLAAGTARVVLNAVEVRGEIVWGSPKTKAGRRTVPIPPTVVELLREHLDRYADTKPDAPVFGGTYGGILRAGAWRSRYFYPAVKRAGIERLRPHDLRHTAGRALDRGRREPEADRAVGWAHVGVGGARSLWPPLRRSRRVRARTADDLISLPSVSTRHRQLLPIPAGVKTRYPSDTSTPVGV